MAGENEKQVHRRSFFRFGNISVDKDDQTVSMDKAKIHMSKNGKAKRPLDLQPLRNRNPFIEEAERSGDKEVLEDEPSSREVLSASNPIPDTRQLQRMNTNPFLNNDNLTGMPKNAQRKRRPPPPIDMEAVKVFAEASPLDATTSIGTGQLSSTDETLKSVSYSPTKTPVPQIKSSSKQHRRQRSEAEKLVDDLDDYIREHESKSQSLSPEEQVGDTNSVDNYDSDSSLESPFVSVDPLSMVASDVENRIEDRSGVRKSDLVSELDTDAFSFTDSLNGKSVNSIQQVAMSESNGAAPILMNLRYTSSHPTSSDSNEKKESTVAHSQPVYQDDFSTDELSEQTNTQNTKGTVFDESKDDDEKYRLGKEEPRRTFRVVNEDRPQFYFQTGGDGATTSTSTSTTSDDDGIGIEGNYELHNSREENDDRLFDSKCSEDNNRQIANGEQEHQKSPSLSTKEESSHLSQVFDKVGSLLDGGALKIEDVGAGATQTLDTSTVFSNPSIKSNGSVATTTSSSSRPDKSVRLVSSYVEELRLKYYKTSNFLAAPPNLPVTLKQKNNLIQPKNIKVRIRTSSKQIGIKHGGAKQKLLSLETANEDSGEGFGGGKIQSNKNRIGVDHTKEFHELLNNGGISKASNRTKERKTSQESTEDLEKYLYEIPGDEAYDSDDAMAPLREKGSARSHRGPTRSNTVVSYFTKNQGRLRSGTLDNGYAYLQDLPTNINLKDYEDRESVNDSGNEEPVVDDDSSSLEPTFSYSKGQGLHVANPDTDSD